MKSLRLIVLLLLMTFAAACASSEVEPYGSTQDEADAQGADVVEADTATDASNPADAGAADAADAGGRDSGGEGDGGGTGDTGSADAEDASQDTGGDVRLDTGSDTGSGGECTTDNDCANGGRCHDREPVCVPSCCDNVTHQDSFTAVGYSHNRFDIAVNDAGEPAIVVVDGDTNVIKYAQAFGGQWLSQDIGSVSQSLSTHVRISFAPDGTPHVIVGRYEMLKHFWRDTSGWQSHDLLADPGSVSYIDIDVDTSGHVHMIALVGSGQVLYAGQTSSGLRSQESLSLPVANNAVWTNIAATGDGRPIASFQIGLDKNLVIAEKSAAGVWSYEVVGQDVSQLHGLAVGPDDNPFVAYRKQTNDGVRVLRRQGATWQDDLIVANPNHGYSPDIAVDSLGDPHVVYQVHGAGQYDNPLYYARWNGAQWENHHLDSVARAFYPRIVLDTTDTPHVVVYDPTSETISYLQVR